MYMSSPKVYLILVSFVMIVNPAYGQFFNWMIDYEYYPDNRQKAMIQKKMPDHNFNTEFQISNDDWLCTITKPNGFKTDGYGDDSVLYQEGVDMTCKLTSNPKVTVRDYVACTKWTQGPYKNTRVENSIAKLNMTGSSGQTNLSVLCSEKTWASQGQKPL